MKLGPCVDLSAIEARMAPWKAAARSASSYGSFVLGVASIPRIKGPDPEATRELGADLLCLAGFFHVLGIGEPGEDVTMRRMLDAIRATPCKGRLGALRCHLPEDFEHREHEATDAQGARVRWT